MKNCSQGFTLIELLVVVAIIGVIAAIVVLAINPTEMMRKARDARRYDDIKKIDIAIQTYIAENEHAPYLQDLCGPENPSMSCLTYDFALGWDVLAQDLSAYLGKLPTDPCGLKCYQQTGQYHAYYYYAPAYFKEECTWLYPNPPCETLDNNHYKTMYVLYANTFEYSNPGRWGFAHNPWNSF